MTGRVESPLWAHFENLPTLVDMLYEHGDECILGDESLDGTMLNWLRTLDNVYLPVLKNWIERLGEDWRDTETLKVFFSGIEFGLGLTYVDEVSIHGDYRAVSLPVRSALTKSASMLNEILRTLDDSRKMREMLGDSDLA